MAVFTCIYSVTCNTTKCKINLLLTRICNFDTLQFLLPVVRNEIIKHNAPPLWLSTIRLEQGCKLFQYKSLAFCWHFTAMNNGPQSQLLYLILTDYVASIVKYSKLLKSNHKSSQKVGVWTGGTRRAVLCLSWGMERKLLRGTDLLEHVEWYYGGYNEALASDCVSNSTTCNENRSTYRLRAVGGIVLLPANSGACWSLNTEKQLWEDQNMAIKTLKSNSSEPLEVILFKF